MCGTTIYDVSICYCWSSTSCLSENVCIRAVRRPRLPAMLLNNNEIMCQTRASDTTHYAIKPSLLPYLSISASLIGVRDKYITVIPAQAGIQNLDR